MHSTLITSNSKCVKFPVVVVSHVNFAKRGLKVGCSGSSGCAGAATADATLCDQKEL